MGALYPRTHPRVQGEAPEPHNTIRFQIHRNCSSNCDLYSLGLDQFYASGTPKQISIALCFCCLLYIHVHVRISFASGLQKIGLQIKLQLENVAKVSPEGDDFRWYLKVSPVTVYDSCHCAVFLLGPFTLLCLVFSDPLTWVQPFWHSLDLLLVAVEMFKLQ